MRLLQRYILRELFWPTVGSLFFFTALMLIMRLFRLTDMLLQTDIRGSLLLELLGILTMSLLTVTIPMAILLATMIAFGRMAAENEILAVRAAGLSLWAVFRPVLMGAAAVSVALMILNASFVPGLFRGAARLLRDIRFDAITNLQPQTFYTDPQLRLSDYNLELYYDTREDIERTPDQMILGMKEIALQLVSRKADKDDYRETLIFARRGKIIGDHRTKAISIVLEDGTLLPLNLSDPQESITVGFGQMTKMIQGEMRERVRMGEMARNMTLGELLTCVASPPASPPPAGGKQPKEWRAYYTQVNELILRFSLPLSCVAFVAIAMPLAIAVRRGQKSIAFAITFVLMFLYYTMFDYGEALGERGHTIGWLLIVFPNILIGAIGGWLMGRAVKR